MTARMAAACGYCFTHDDHTSECIAARVAASPAPVMVPTTRFAVDVTLVDLCECGGEITGPAMFGRLCELCDADAGEEWRADW